MEKQIPDVYCVTLSLELGSFPTNLYVGDGVKEIIAHSEKLPHRRSLSSGIHRQTQYLHYSMRKADPRDMWKIPSRKGLYASQEPWSSRLLYVSWFEICLCL